MVVHLVTLIRLPLLGAVFRPALPQRLREEILFGCRAAWRYQYTAITMIANGIVAITWNQEAPHLFEWGTVYMLGHLSAQLVGGFFGVMLGRPLTRLGVRIVFPASVRPRLAYLWSADGKPFPRTQPG